jgi:divalent metal cation (Fe/Co/Zn/Cd) transporter
MLRLGELGRAVELRLLGDVTRVGIREPLMARAVTRELAADEHALLIRRVKLISWIGLAWLLVDGAIGMTAGLAANSVALIGWGLDCAIQAIASLIIIWRFTGDRVHSPDAERLSQKAVGVSFFLLAPYIVVTAIDHLATGNASAASWLGVGLAGTDMLLMPVLGHAKRRIGNALGSHATAGEGRQNILCAYLSLAVLVGLGANALFGLWWADPVVGLLVAIVVIQAGVRTWRGEACDAVPADA